MPSSSKKTTVPSEFSLQSRSGCALLPMSTLVSLLERMLFFPDQMLEVENQKCKKADLYTRAKIRKEMKSKTQSMEEIRVDPDDILFCSLCFEEDPELPPDMDPEEPDARETQWMRCTECRIWAHAICARDVQFRSCKACKKGKYSIDVYES